MYHKIVSRITGNNTDFSRSMRNLFKIVSI